MPRWRIERNKATRAIVTLAVALFAFLLPISSGAEILEHRPGEVVVLFKGASTPERFVFGSDSQADSAIERYRRSPSVKAVSRNSLVRITGARLTPSDEYFVNQWYLEKIRAPEAWKVSQGSRSIVVAVLDTGVDLDHPDLRNNIWTNPGEVLDGLDNDGNGYRDDVHGWDFVDDVGDPQPHFKSGWSEGGVNHGTIVAGLVGAAGNNQIGVAGVAWNVRIMPIRVLDSFGVGDVESVARGIDYALRNGAQILNLSFVGLERSEVLEAAIERAWNAGLLIVAAAGNDGGPGGGVNLDASPRYPVCSDGGAGNNYVLGVTATDELDRKATFSDFGSHCLDIAAPGVSVYSTRYQNSSLPGFGAAYGGFWQGTSLATPLVSGAAALIKSLNPLLSNIQIREVLKQNAVSIDAENPLYAGKLGAGRINLFGSVEKIAGSLPPAASSRSYMGVAAPPGVKPEIRLFTRDGAFVRSFTAYASPFIGGVVAASGDLDGDLFDEIVTGPMSAGGPHIRIFTTAGLQKGEFFAFDSTLRGGLSLAVGDVSGDGIAEIVAAPRSGSSPLVRVFDGKGNEQASFLAYDPAFRGGVFLAVGDVDGDGVSEIITAPGPGGGPHIRLFDGRGRLKWQFFAGQKDDTRGWRVGSGDTQLQGSAGIGVMPATGTARTLKLFTGLGVLYGIVDLSTSAPLFPFTLGDIEGSGRSYLLVSVPTSAGMSLSVYDTDGRERAYVLTYLKGLSQPPNPFVVRKP